MIRVEIRLVATMCGCVTAGVTVTRMRTRPKWYQQDSHSGSDIMMPYGTRPYATAATAFHTGVYGHGGYSFSHTEDSNLHFPHKCKGPRVSPCSSSEIMHPAN